MFNRKVRYTMDLTPEMNDLVTWMAVDSGVTKSEIFRRAFALYNVARKAARASKRIGADPDLSKFQTVFVNL